MQAYFNGRLRWPYGKLGVYVRHLPWLILFLCAAGCGTEGSLRVEPAEVAQLAWDRTELRLSGVHPHAYLESPSGELQPVADLAVSVAGWPASIVAIAGDGIRVRLLAQPPLGPAVVRLTARGDTYVAMLRVLAAWDGGAPSDARALDGAGPDTGPDGGLLDSGAPDSGASDTGPPDTGPPDTGPPDTGPPDAGVDAGMGFLVPSNVGNRVSMTAGSADLRPAGSLVVVNTDDGSITAYDGPDPATAAATVLRPRGTGLSAGVFFARLAPVATGGAPLGVFASQSLRVDVGVTVVGQGTRALVWLASGLVRVDGTLSVAAGALPILSPGPGGGAGGDADPAGPPDVDGVDGAGAGRGRGGISSAFNDGGGGGASFATSGARGGRTEGGAAGLPYGAGSLVPLAGGSGGGSGADNDGGDGGHGGGALQISAQHLRIFGGGVIEAGGGGGRGAPSSLARSDTGGGGGGGSGGAVLLEALTVQIDGQVAVHGGAGGQGGPVPVDGVDGAHGRVAPVPAPGSASRGLGGGGGDGSDLAGVPQPGREDINGGGGGGGAGRIRVNTPSGAAGVSGAGSLAPLTSTTYGLVTLP